MVRKINRNSTEYDRFLAVYLNTKNGRAFAYSVLSQLVDGFEVDAKGRITSASLSDKPLVIDFE